MRVARTSSSFSRPASRCLTGLLSLLMVALPTAGQSAADSSAKSAHSASTAKQKASRPKAKKAAPAVKSKAKAGKKSSKAVPSASVDENAASTTAGKAASKASKLTSKAAGHKVGRTTSKAARQARTASIKQAFVASAELRSMAQQLANLRTPAAYAGVTAYAHKHTGEAAAAAYLALGHAYLLDKHDAEAVTNLRLARQAGGELADYADFLSARANHEAGNDAAAEATLRGFADRYPDSIFVAEAPELEAQTLLAMSDAAGAQRVLAAAAGTASANRPGFQLAQAQAAFAMGESEAAEHLYKRLLLARPLASEAEVAFSKLKSMGAESNLTTAEMRSLGDAYYNAGHYEQAEEHYRTLAREPGLDARSRAGFAVAAAACDLKLKRLTTAQAEALADTADENGARRLYLLMELARNRDDLTTQQSLVTRLEEDFPQSQWLAEALFSSGNMYLLRRDYATAASYYNALATRFPSGKNAAAAHWKAGWLSYRQGLYAQAARIFDEQIRLYPGATETVAALYWRGRLYETQEHKPAQAAASYRTVVRAYQHYFYAQMARQRLVGLGDAPPIAQPQLDSFQPPPPPTLDDNFPTDSPHLAKARLLANAGLNDFIAREIAADPDSSTWGALAEAQIYASYGEHFRALRAIKRALPAVATASVKSIPLAYWRILFPEPWWETIKAESAKNGLDPYLVASLIRQESEFNPAAISKANACGLMQLLPSVGRSLARQEGISHFENFQLFDPATNIRLGTRYLRQTLDKFGGVTEYALAAYDAGDGRVTDWKAAGPYQGIDEFVESIPFTETREYVEAILRNRETYKAIDAYAAAQGRSTTGQ